MDMKTMLKYGIINIDKPQGPTSHQVSEYVQRILGINKAGHSGTLDPQTSGVLPVALGKATRIVQALLPAGKEYVAIMHLHNDVNEHKLRQAFKKMTGKIKQLPPKKSAIKRQWRYRKIYEVKILEIKGQDVLFTISCEAGTYIRKYIHDLGELLGCGAHMSELRRTRAGPFDESTLVTLQELTDAMHFYKEGDDTLLRKYIQPIETAVVLMKKVVVKEAYVEKLLHGINPEGDWIQEAEEGIEPDQEVAVMTEDAKLIGLGRAKMIPRKMEGTEEAVALHKVFLSHAKQD